MGADLIIVLDDGRPVGVGKHNELLSSCAIYKEICATQFRRDDAPGVFDGSGKEADA